MFLAATVTQFTTFPSKFLSMAMCQARLNDPDAMSAGEERVFAYCSDFAEAVPLRKGNRKRQCKAEEMRKAQDAPKGENLL